jgi:hypothetical protein
VTVRTFITQDLTKQVSEREQDVANLLLASVLANDTVKVERMLLTNRTITSLIVRGVLSVDHKIGG